MSGPHVSPLILRYCKRGHPKTEETTFERKARVNGKDYIVRECRICHAMRNNSSVHITPNSKWSRFLRSQTA